MSSLRYYNPWDWLVGEPRFYLSSWYPGLFWTCDAVLYRPSTGELRVYDLKYGRGVPVEVERNSQELYYGLGATMAEPGRLVNTVELVIEIGRAHVCTPDTNAHLVCRLLLEQTNPAHKHHTSFHLSTVRTCPTPLVDRGPQS